MQQQDRLAELDASVRSAIEQTERYYREQIFSSGCSSIVPIYRISSSIRTVEELLRQFQGSPYIQSHVEFSEQVIQNLLDVDVYLYDRYHFFVNGTLNPEVTKFIEEKCVQVESFSKVVKVSGAGDINSWLKLGANLDSLVSAYPVLASLDCPSLVKVVMEVLGEVKLEESISKYLNMFAKSALGKKFMPGQSALLCMVAMGQEMCLRKSQVRDLVLLGLLKDIGYARLNEQIVDFEVMHPLVSHKILLDSKAIADQGYTELSSALLNAVILHHEFVDGSGPLARMRHPVVKSVLANDMPIIAQISGICDLYFGFLEKYSPGIAYAITCGFVLGQGDLPSRYDAKVVKAFVTVMKAGSCEAKQSSDQEAESLIDGILDVLRDSEVKNKANGVIMNRSDSWFERITLTLNIVRNIALRQPTHISENSLVGVLHLPLEFGLSY